MENTKNINIANTGMNRNSHPMNLNEREYTLAINSNIESAEGNSFNLTNEKSTLLCSQFKPGFKVIGVGKDLTLDRTYFLLVNPTTNVSEIGYIDNIPDDIDLSDEEVVCDTCDYKNDLSTPLEEQTQVQTCIYYTIINDTCNKCLGFDIRYPIHSVIIKDEKSGKGMYFAGANYPARYLNLDDIEQYYLYTNAICDEEPVTMCEHDETCSDCEDCNQCINCDKMLIFKNHTKPCIHDNSVIQGGNLKQGIYSALLAYCNNSGEEISDYYSLTQYIKIFDNQNLVMEQPDLDRTTGLAIKLEIEDLDRQFDYYKVVFIQSNSVDGAQSYYEEGVHPTTDTTVLYTSDRDKQRTTLQEILKKSPKWKTAEGLATSNGYLYQYGLTAQNEVNLQPIVTLMSPFLKWQIGVANEDLYKDGSADSKYSGYMRNEVYPYSLKLFSDDGWESAKFPLTNRPPNANELEILDVSNADMNSINEYSPSCEGTRNKRWQYYNTATVDASQHCTMDVTGETVEVDGETSCEAGTITMLGSTYTFTPPTGYTNFLNYIKENIETITDPSIVILVNQVKALDCCTPDLNDNCELTSSTPINTNVLVSYVDVISETDVEKPLSEYSNTASPSICNVYAPNTSGTATLREQDSSFVTSYLSVGDVVYKRNTITNINCPSATALTNNGIQGNFLTYAGATSAIGLQDTNKSAIPMSVGSEDYFANLHINAIWFKIDLGTADKKLVEITQRAMCDYPNLENRFVGQTIRATVYTSCGTVLSHSVINSPTTPINLTTGGKFEINKEGTTTVYYIALDSSIEATSDPLKWYLSPPCGCFGILDRQLEYSEKTVEFENLAVTKICTYSTSCTYSVPQYDPCGVVPYLTGKFGYWESIEQYPDNSELYDSSTIKISQTGLEALATTLGETIDDEFVEYFTDSGEVDSDGNYVLNNNTVLKCTPIRHYKMPGNDKAPFMISTPILGMQESLIFPLGVKLDNRIINFFLDAAVSNGLLTQELRNKITKYEIFRGDRTLDRGIISKGLLYDTYKYNDDTGSEILYPNYPYNTLGNDNLNFTDSNRNTLIPHPFNSEKNNRFTFHGAETHFSKPILPTEIEYEGYQFGEALGKFTQVNSHPEYVMLGQDAYRVATALAIAESVLETTLILSQAYLDYIDAYYVQLGTATGANITGIIIGTTIVALLTAGQAVATGVFKTGRYRYEWLNAFRTNGKHKNYANYYSSHGWYNFMDFDSVAHTEGNRIRGIRQTKYLKPGRTAITEGTSSIKINNENRESSVYISLGDSYYFNYGTNYINYDNSNNTNNSRIIDGIGTCINSRAELSSKIASPYVSLKNYLPAQYGVLDNIKWLTTSYCGDLLTDNSCDIIFGGDIRISRMSLKRKMPLFTTNAMGLANQTPFAYSLYNNIGNTRYFADFDISLDEQTGASAIFDNIFPDISSNYNFHCQEDDKFYMPVTNKFYLSFYGIPQFLVESEINLNYRYAGKTPEQWFFPKMINDYTQWTQEKQVPISEDNSYYFNFTYARNVIPDAGRILPGNFEQAKWDTLYQFPNGVISSLQDINEQSLTNPWLSYRPFDIYQFPKSYGKLIDILPLESQTVAIRFENQMTVTNSIDVLRERLNTENSVLGTGIFGSTRPIEIASSSLGYMGTQHKQSLSTEWGKIVVDCRRGTIFNIGDKGAKDLANMSNMRQWLKEHLPFKLLKGKIENLTDLDVDNAYNGAGIALAYDDRTKRFLLTKKDYKVKALYINHIRWRDNNFYFVELDDELNEVETLISLTNTTYFEDASFTIGYSFLTESFISYYSYKPNYYVSHINYFSSGNNNSLVSDENGLWNHSLTNKSFQVFYGTKYPWTIEFSDKNAFAYKTYQGTTYSLEARRYHNLYDYAENREIGFNEAHVYNANNNSGKLNLITAQVNNRFQKTQYPITNIASTDILATQHDGHWSFNSAWNIVRNDLANVPIFINDINEIDKTINSKAVKSNKHLNDYLRGDYFLTRLTQNASSQYQFIFKWAVTKSNILGGQ